MMKQLMPLLLGSTLFLGACALLPESVPNQFFDLEARAEARDTRSPSEQILLVGPVQFPESHRRQQILLRKQDGAYDIDESLLWTGAIDESFTRVLSQNLELLLGTDRVLSYPAGARTLPDLQILLSVRRFEPIEWQEVVLDAQWQIVSDAADRPALVGTGQYRLPANGSVTDSVSQMSELLVLLAQDIRDDLFSE